MYMIFAVVMLLSCLSDSLSIGTIKCYGLVLYISWSSSRINDFSHVFKVPLLLLLLEIQAIDVLASTKLLSLLTCLS